MRIQAEAQAKWSELSVFEEDAPAPDAMDCDQEKFLVTFPYPYCNGFLHIGHAFTISKAEFVAGYKRMKGVKCLFPFGFHCTGMPIQTCANKLASEIATYGNPPHFPVDDAEDSPDIVTGTVDKTRATKGKAASKASKKKYQWEILKESGIADDQIALFADPLAWLNYFPLQNVADLTTFGLKADWRRAFITTEANPFYDSFIRWQFNTLRSLNKIKFGKRNAVFSPIDMQPCADHDRASGEGVQPQDYTLIKMKLLKLPDTPDAGTLLTGRDVYLPAATLRPETMYGQTNCWVLPTGEYVAYELANGDIFIASRHSGRNMAFQDFFSEYGCAKELTCFSGSDLIGLPVKSPLAQYDQIYVLPLLTVSMGKGTGVVTSVPSDAPDDYRGLMDLKEKEPLRAKFSIRDEWVMPFEPIPIVDTPGFGSLAAVEACTRYKIRSQNDKDALAKAKEEVYKAGFYSGTMLVGTMVGEPVMRAKTRIREEMLASGEACVYAEPEKKIMSRSGGECVVALCDQWYLEYGEPVWREQVERHLKSMNLYADETRNAFGAVLGWLKEWACSRHFGLGTKLPWDKEWLIESLSDSTIYMAYYTVAHLLQGGPANLNGTSTGPSGLSAGDMTDAVWDYVLLGKTPGEGGGGLSHVDPAILAKLRREFTYWYPVDLRVSGKDLIGNHLPFFLYNHAAIFPEELQPRGIRVNGHVLLNAEKMSKSTGNFLTLRDGMARYSSDGVRFALADAADTVEDANFSLKTADEAVLKLWTLIDFIEEGVNVIESMQTGPLTRFADRVFATQLNSHLHAAEDAYDRMLFREALKVGFYEVVNDVGKYREAVGADKSTKAASTLPNMHRDVFLQFVHFQVVMLTPICSHSAEHLWGLICPILERRDGVSLSPTVINAQWPAADAPDESLLAASAYLNDILSRVRAVILKPAKKKKGKGPAEPIVPLTSVSVFVRKEPQEWQQISLKVLTEAFDADAWSKSKEENPEKTELWWKYPSDTPKRVAAAMPPELKKNKKMMPYVAMVRNEVELGGAGALDRTIKFDEEAILRENHATVLAQLATFGIQHVHVMDVSQAPEGANVADAVPGTPAFQVSA